MLLWTSKDEGNAAPLRLKTLSRTGNAPPSTTLMLIPAPSVTFWIRTRC